MSPSAPRPPSSATARMMPLATTIPIAVTAMFEYRRASATGRVAAALTEQQDQQQQAACPAGPGEHVDPLDRLGQQGSFARGRVPAVRPKPERDRRCDAGGPGRPANGPRRDPGADRRDRRGDHEPGGRAAPRTIAGRCQTARRWPAAAPRGTRWPRGGRRSPRRPRVAVAPPVRRGTVRSRPRRSPRAASTGVERGLGRDRERRRSRCGRGAGPRHRTGGCPHPNANASAVTCPSSTDTTRHVTVYVPGSGSVIGTRRVVRSTTCGVPVGTGLAPLFSSSTADSDGSGASEYVRRSSVGGSPASIRPPGPTTAGRRVRARPARRRAGFPGRQARRRRRAPASRRPSFEGDLGRDRGVERQMVGSDERRRQRVRSRWDAAEVHDLQDAPHRSRPACRPG